MRRRRHSTNNSNPENPSVVRTLSTDALSPNNKAAEEILKSANAAAGTIRNLFISYILLAVYILITVGSTNDEQLLRDSGVAVPFLSNITLPVSYFYQFAPWLFGFYHFELLIHFKLLADKLHAFNHELEPLPDSTQEDLRQRLASFPFSHWLAGERDDVPMQFVTGLVVWVTLFLLPLFTLLALQIGFLPYHSDLTTLSHRLAVLGDAAALGFFWPKLVESYPGNPLDWWRERLQAWPSAVKSGIWWLFVVCFAWECWSWFFDGAYMQQLVVSTNPVFNVFRYGLIFAPLALWWIYRAWRWAKRRLWTKRLSAVPLAIVFMSLSIILLSALKSWPEILFQRLVAFYAELSFIVRWPKFLAGNAERSWLGIIGCFPPFSWLARIIQWLRPAPINGETRPTASTGLTAQGPFALPATTALFLAAYISVLVAVLPDTGLEKGNPLTVILFEKGFSWPIATCTCRKNCW